MSCLKNEVSDDMSDISDISDGTCSSLSEEGTVCHDRRKECCLMRQCGKPDTRPPFARTMPEGRRYGVVISNEDRTASVDTSVVMAHLFSVIENCDVPKLRFSECVPMSEFCGNMLVVCQDEDTAKWVISTIEVISPPHAAVPFIKFFGLMRCFVVLPFFEPKESTCSIFNLMELQNGNVETNKWSVVGRTELDPCEKTEFETVQNFVGNEVMELYIDSESREVIECQCSRMKFLFWTVVFNFC